MDVYVVRKYQDNKSLDEAFIEEIFSTEEKAKAYIKRIERFCGRVFYQRWKLDNGVRE